MFQLKELSNVGEALSNDCQYQFKKYTDKTNTTDESTSICLPEQIFTA